MAGLHLDTSGVVHIRTEPHGDWRGIGWTDLDPFTQGYVGALLRAHHEAACEQATDYGQRLPKADRFKFSDLSSAAVALIMKDCSSLTNILSGLDQKTGEAEGRRIWAARQSGALPGAFGAAFPPLTVTLVDGGNVHLAEAGQ